MPSKDVTKLEKKLEQLESMLESGVRSKSAMGTVKLDKLDKQNLRREIKDIKAELNKEYNRTGKKGNTLGLSLNGEIGEPGTTMPPAGKKTSSSSAGKKDRPKLVERKGPSYSDDMTPPKRFSEASGRKFIRDILGDDTKVEYEDMSEAGPDGARKGGMRKKAAPKSKYGMKAGGFTKRGGMYKKGMS
jgi:hypothetical protein